MLSGAFIVFVLTVFIAYYVVPGRAQAYLLSGAGLRDYVYIPLGGNPGER